MGAHAACRFSELAPKGLYARALIIIIAPIVLLESVVAFTFMERHWNQVTRRLSEGMARDMAAIVDLYESSTGKDDIAQLIDIGQNRFGLSVAVLPAGNLPTPQPKPFFDLLDRALSDEIRANVKRPFWIDTRRPVAARRDPRQARSCHPALRRSARAGLRVQLAHLPDLDGGHVGRPADRGDPVSAQSDPSGAAACGSGRRLRQGPTLSARVQAARRPRGAAGGAGVPGDARAHPAPRRAAHDHAGRRAATICAPC